MTRTTTTTLMIIEGTLYLVYVRFVVDEWRWRQRRCGADDGRGLVNGERNSKKEKVLPVFGC